MAIFIPILIVAIIGAVAGVILVIISKVMAVEVDELTVSLRDALPGANCGACGFAGCDDYAAALTADKDINTNLCTPGGNETSRQLAELLGVDFQESAANFAIVRCSGTLMHTSYKMDYQGHPSCAANKTFFKGRFVCDKSCLGFGDCAKACPYGAITVADGLAVIDRHLCIGCGLCASHCPSQLIDVIPGTARYYVGCSTDKPGAKTRKLCDIGCISCGLCVKKCAYEAITIKDGHAQINYKLCENCGACAEVCPKKVIQRIS